jgi:hypothetical protein
MCRTVFALSGLMEFALKADTLRQARTLRRQIYLVGLGVHMLELPFMVVIVRHLAGERTWGGGGGGRGGGGQRTEDRRQKAKGRGQKVLVLVPAHVSVADQEHDWFGQVARDAEHDAPLIHVVLAINNHFGTRVGQKVL